jgi:hypothetical protein
VYSGIPGRRRDAAEAPTSNSTPATLLPLFWALSVGIARAAAAGDPGVVQVEAPAGERLLRQQRGAPAPAAVVEEAGAEAE